MAAPVSRDAWKHRNVLLCIALSILLVAFVVVFAIFMPLYLANVRRLEPRTWSWLMSMFGLTSMAFAFLVPGSSDVVGRRPVVISMSLLGALIPLSALYVDQPLWLCSCRSAWGRPSAAVFRWPWPPFRPRPYRRSNWRLSWGLPWVSARSWVEW